MEDGQLIAVKRLIRGSQEEMTADYLSELGILVHVNHPNISRVIGYGVEGGMHLVLPLSANGCLSSMLKGLSFFYFFPTLQDSKLYFLFSFFVHMMLRCNGEFDLECQI